MVEVDLEEGEVVDELTEAEEFDGVVEDEDEDAADVIEDDDDELADFEEDVLFPVLLFEEDAAVFVDVDSERSHMPLPFLSI